MSLDALVTAERNGTLTPRQKQLLDTARQRGLIGTPKNDMADGLKELAGINAALVAEIVKVIGKQKAPVVNTPEVRVSVPETVVNVEAVMPKERPRLRIDIERDDRGNISTMYIEPI